MHFLFLFFDIPLCMLYKIVSFVCLSPLSILDSYFNSKRTEKGQCCSTQKENNILFIQYI